jgi:4-hydroxy-tetrahydrodipicolinate synthase
MQKALDPEDMIIVCGPGQMLFPFEVLFDCPAFVTELTNFAPSIPVRFHKAAQKKDYDELTKLMDLAAPYHELIAKAARNKGGSPTIMSPYISSDDVYVYQSACKEAMNLVGLPGGKMRGPMSNLTAEEIGELKDILTKMGALN